MCMRGRIKQRLGTLGQVGVWTVVVGVALNIALEILPYTDYPISQNLARVLFWVSVGILVFGGVIIIIAFSRHSQKESKEKPQTGNTDNLERVVVSILNEIHKRDVKLKNAAKKQYLKLFNLKDFTELWDNFAITRSGQTYESIKKEYEEKEVEKDKIQRRKQIDELQQKIDTIIVVQDWTSEDYAKLASFFENFPRTQNGAYLGVGRRREINRKWQSLFHSLNNLRLEHAQVFADKELTQMIEEYFDNSKIIVTLKLIIELIETLIPSDFLPTEFLEGGVEDASIKVSNRMTKLLEDISKRITELERQQSGASMAENHNEL